MTDTKVKSKSKVKTNSKDNKYKDRTVNVPRVKEIIAEKGYTPTKICNILGITGSTFWNWEHYKRANCDSVYRMAKLLEVPIESMYYPIDSDSDKEIDDTTNSGENEVVLETTISAVGDMSIFKEIGDTQNVHTQFDTINSNVIMLADMLKGYIDSKFDALYSELHKEYLQLHNELSAFGQQSVSVDKNVNEKPKAFIINNVEITKLVTGYNENDSYDVYKEKINRMVSNISKCTRTPHKNILHGFYIEMTNVYGVVYDQLKKEYFEKYQHTDNGSTELIYENPIFKQIFYNLISDELKKVTKGV